MAESIVLYSEPHTEIPGAVGCKRDPMVKASGFSGGELKHIVRAKHETGTISIMHAGAAHEVHAGPDGVYLFAKFMPALC